ncbi:unnamed protein product [Ilex paraguariensis]|uniref:Uncharacterized protein n=1 Tax=Ilex paraguariensis TaxID=185542 RepID=A0ABC8TFA3_9AQUA
MHNSILQDTIESGEDEHDYYLADDDHDSDGSHFIYLVNTILSGTARLNILLPTATILAFSIFSPLLTNYGQCNAFDRWLMAFFLAFSAISCIFFSFTDSFRTATGRLYYGLATIHGIRTFNCGRVKPCLPGDYRLRWADLFHAGLSLVAFLTFVASHGDVLSCYNVQLPRKEKRNWISFLATR